MMLVPTKKPTPAEYAVLLVFISGGLITLGTVAIVVAWRAPEEKKELTSTLLHYGLWSIGIGVAIACLFWLFRRLVD